MRAAGPSCLSTRPPHRRGRPLGPRAGTQALHSQGHTEACGRQAAAPPPGRPATRGTAVSWPIPEFQASGNEAAAAAAWGLGRPPAAQDPAPWPGPSGPRLAPLARGRRAKAAETLAGEETIPWPALWKPLSSLTSRGSLLLGGPACFWDQGPGWGWRQKCIRLAHVYPAPRGGLAWARPRILPLPSVLGRRDRRTLPLPLPVRGLRPRAGQRREWQTRRCYTLRKRRAGGPGRAGRGSPVSCAPVGEAVRAAEMSHAGVLRAPLWPRGGRAEATVAGDPAGAHRVTQQGGGAGGSPRALRTEPGRFPDQQSWDSIPGPAEAAAEVGGGEGGRSLSQRRPSTVHASGVQDRVSCRREVSKSHRDRRQSREMAPPWRHTPKSLRLHLAPRSALARCRVATWVCWRAPVGANQPVGGGQRASPGAFDRPGSASIPKSLDRCAGTGPRATPRSRDAARSGGSRAPPPPRPRGGCTPIPGKRRGPPSVRGFVSVSVRRLCEG